MRDGSKLDGFGPGADDQANSFAVQPSPYLGGSKVPPLWRKSSSLAEVVGVGLDLEPDRRGGEHVVGQTVPVAVGDGRILRREGQANLRPSVARAVPPGQRIRPLSFLTLELEEPLAGLGLAGLGGLARDFGNAGGGHGRDVAKSAHGIKGARRHAWCAVSAWRLPDRRARDVSDSDRACPLRRRASCLPRSRGGPSSSVSVGPRAS